MKRGPKTATAAGRWDQMPRSELVPIPSVDFAYATCDGEIYSNHPNSKWRGAMRKLRAVENGRGYLRVVCGGKLRSVHALVAEAFIGPRPSGLEVNHKDGDKRNNRPENLEYVTRSENMRHCFRIGLGNPPRGDNHFSVKLKSAEQVKVCWDYWMLCDGRAKLPNGAMKYLCEKYGVTDTAIRRYAVNKFSTAFGQRGSP